MAADNQSERLPYQQWYWQDWFGDRKVALLSRSARLAWFELIGLIHLEGCAGSMEIRVDDLASHWRVPPDEAAGLLHEIRDRHAADVEVADGLAKVTCRRMVRDTSRRIRDRQRKREYRERIMGQDAVVPVGHGVGQDVVVPVGHGVGQDVVVPSTQSPESRVQRLETRDQRPEARGQRTDKQKDHPVEPATAAVDAVGAVYATYRSYHKASPTKASPKHRRLIGARLKEGFEREVLELAIHGNHCDPHCCGENERNKTYHGLDLILRDADHVTSYLESLARHGRQDLAERARAHVGDTPSRSAGPPRRMTITEQIIADRERAARHATTGDASGNGAR